jgi:hypothetical protein
MISVSECMASEGSVLYEPVDSCSIATCTDCYAIDTQKIFTVGPNVSLLSDLYPFCIKAPSICGSACNVLRLLFLIDASASMCYEVTQCSGASKNDPGDMRIETANALIDSIALRCPTCEIGTMVFTAAKEESIKNSAVTSVQPPRALTTIDFVNALHNSVNSGRCAPGMPLSKPPEMNKIARKNLTYTGFVLDSAISIIDAGYDTLRGTDRQIILFTDGDWQSPAPQQIADNYASKFPGRKLPVIHGVFISDSATHVRNGFPPQGLLSCDSTSGTFIPADVTFLKTAAVMTKGIFINCSNPLALVDAFRPVFHPINDTAVVPPPRSIVVTKSKTGEQKQAQFAIDPLNHGKYHIKPPPFPLDFGENIFGISLLYQDTNGVRLKKIDTILVHRLYGMSIESSSRHGTNEWKTGGVSYRLKQTSCLRFAVFDLLGRQLFNSATLLETGKSECRCARIIRYPNGKMQKRIFSW